MDLFPVYKYFLPAAAATVSFGYGCSSKRARYCYEIDMRWNKVKIYRALVKLLPKLMILILIGSVIH